LGRKRIERCLGKQQIEGKHFRLLQEVRYIQRRAAVHDGRIVTFGQLVLFSTETGDAWLLDIEDHLATRLAQDGDPLPVHIEDTIQASLWNGRANIGLTAPPSSMQTKSTGRVLSILGYPTDRLSTST
jgi:hypothetical protein